jgi:hypothetical protein
MKTIFLTILLVSASSSYAMQAHNAAIIQHTSTVSGSDDQGHAIEGHIENYEENFIVKFFKKHTRKNVKKPECSCPK